MEAPAAKSLEHETHPTVETPRAPSELIDGLLDTIPVRPCLPTLRRVPRGLERRYARIRLMTLEWALDATEAALPADLIRAWHLLARAAPW